WCLFPGSPVPGCRIDAIPHGVHPVSQRRSESARDGVEVLPRVRAEQTDPLTDDAAAAGAMLEAERESQDGVAKRNVDDQPSAGLDSADDPVGRASADTMSPASHADSISGWPVGLDALDARIGRHVLDAGHVLERECRIG